MLDFAQKGGNPMKYRIKEHREKVRLTQEALAKRANVSRATISALENDRLQVTTTGTLLKLADAMGCKVSDFLSS